MADRTVLPNLGISTSRDEQGYKVLELNPAGTAIAAGVKVGDYLVSLGGIEFGNADFGSAFNAKFAAMPPGGMIQVVVRRGTQDITLNAKANFRTSEQTRIVEISSASPKAIRIREGILRVK